MKEQDVLAPISVIIPCYRCGRTIERAVNSIVKQTLLPKEIILVEDGSGDDTYAVLVEIKNKFGDWIVLTRFDFNRGAASARNRGWELATQPYIAFLDSDDAWHSQKIEYQYKYMLSHPDIALSGHGYRIVSEMIDMPNINGPMSAKLIYPFSLLLSNSLVTPSVMLKSDIPFRFRDNQRYVDDHLLWLEIVLSGLQVARLDIPLALIYKPMYGEGGLSSNMWAMEKAELGNYWRLYREYRISLAKLIFLLPFSFVKYVRRLFIVNIRRLHFRA